MADDVKTTGEKLKVFISYSRRDGAGFADELVAGLELAGFALFIDRDDIKPGEPWKDRLGGLIAQSGTVVFVITPEAVKSEYCTWEVERTLELSKRLLPVVYIDVPENDIPEQLRRLQFVRFDTGRAHALDHGTGRGAAGRSPMDQGAHAAWRTRGALERAATAGLAAPSRRRP